MKTLSTLVLVAGLISPIVSASAQEYQFADNTPYHIRQAVQSQERPAEDTVRDPGRLPAEVLTLADLNAGDSIIELTALGQYYSRLIASAIGPDGRLFMYDLPQFADFGADSSGQAFVESHDNAEHRMMAYDQVDYPSGVDAVYNILSYHDMPAFDVDTAAMNARLFEALKPGGYYVIVDHKAEAGSGWRDSESLHRVDADVIREEVTAAGFELLIDSDLLAHPEDDKSTGVFSARGDTDRAVLIFRKPL